jgi:hypothetical protein
MGERVHTVHKITDTVLAANNELVVDVNAYKSKYIFINLHQSAGRNIYVQTDNSLFESLDEF